jgi:hypothetical protein
MRKAVVWIIVASVVLLCVCAAFAVALATGLSTARVELSSQQLLDLKAPPGSLICCKDGAFLVLQESASTPAATVGLRNVLPTLATCCSPGGVLCHLRRATESAAFELVFFELDNATFVFRNRVPLPLPAAACPLLSHNDDFVFVVDGRCCCHLISFSAGSELERFEFKLNHKLRRLVANKHSLACISDEQLMMLSLKARDRGFVSHALGLLPLRASEECMLQEEPAPRGFQLSRPRSDGPLVASFEADGEPGFVDNERVVFVKSKRLMSFELGRNDSCPGERDLGLSMSVEQIWPCKDHVLVRASSGEFWLVRVAVQPEPVMQFGAEVFHGLDVQEIVQLEASRLEASGLFVVTTKEAALVLGTFARFALDGADFVGVAGETKNGRTLTVQKGTVRLGKAATGPWQSGSVILRDSLSDSLLASHDVGDPHTRQVLAMTDASRTVLVRPSA